MTQTSLGQIDLTIDLHAPLLVGAMTGGAELSGTINHNLAAADQELGIGMMGVRGRRRAVCRSTPDISSSS